MDSLVQWHDDWDKAFVSASDQSLPLLIYFHLPECIGCILMNENTFSDQYIDRLIASNFVALKIHADALPYTEDYGVRWTPHFTVCRLDGFPLLEAMGHQSPQEFGPWLHLALARHNLNLRNWHAALSHLEIIISLHHSSGSAPEAVFLRGIAGYRQSGDTSHMKNAYTKLSEEYQASVWYDRSKPYKDF